ncbi:unnamed protein product [Meganyctiphanes norvegica]|uniref:HTH La-type RNA-binding domain-containing protein n=1 Tax=Meganyctiphanes norvegica TaxID=48144 RepID=A0AAV2S1H4_MEGNR
MSDSNPVQNDSMESMKHGVGSLSSMNSIESSEGYVSDLHDSLKNLNINDKNTIESDKNLNQKYWSHRSYSASSLSSSNGRPNKSIVVVSMKNMLAVVQSSNCVDSSDGGDSNPPKVPINREERIKFLQDLLEFYMSDRYLIKDLFFLKNFKTYKGWISIKFLMSYKRIKRIAKDIDELKEAIKMSPLLKMNEAETKLQRVNDTSNYIQEYIPSKIAIVGGLPAQLRNINEASKLMMLYGDVISLQILRPRGVLPEVLQNVEDIPEIKTQWCIVVEYDEMHSAGKLVCDINQRSDPNLPSWGVELVISWTEGQNKKYGTIKNKRKTHGLTNKERLVTSMSCADNEKVLSNDHPVQQPWQRQQHLQPQKRSNYAHNLKSRIPTPSDPSSGNKNWRRNNHFQKLKSSGRTYSEPSSADDNWRRTPINAGSIDEVETFFKKKTYLVPTKATSIDHSETYISRSKSPRRF